MSSEDTNKILSDAARKTGADDMSEKPEAADPSQKTGPNDLSEKPETESSSKDENKPDIKLPMEGATYREILALWLYGLTYTAMKTLGYMILAAILMVLIFIATANNVEEVQIGYTKPGTVKWKSDKVSMRCYLDLMRLRDFALNGEAMIGKLMELEGNVTKTIDQTEKQLKLVLEYVHQTAKIANETMVNDDPEVTHITVPGCQGRSRKWGYFFL